MKVYKSGDLWVLGLSGGHFNNLQKFPEAIVLKNYPDPIKMWQVKTIIDENKSENEYWEYDYTFREHKGDENNIFFIEIKFTRREPGYSQGSIEYFITEDYLKEKTEWLHNNQSLAEYSWDASKGTWIELYRDFKYEDEEVYDDGIYLLK